MEFVPHASSSAGNLYTCHAGGSVLAIEAGLPWKRLQESLNYRVTELAGLLLSHSHGDHSCSAARVMDSGVNVYASSETLDGLDLRFRHRAHILQPVPLDPAGPPGKHVDIGPWCVLAFEVIHDCPGTLGFLVGAPDHDQLVFATDTAYLPVRVDGCTHIAIEVSFSEATLETSERPSEHISRLIRSHMSLEAAIAMLEANDLSRCKQIFLLHLSGVHGDAREFQETVERKTGIPCTVAARHRRF